MRDLATALVRRRRWLMLAWIAAAALLLPAARRLAAVLDVEARVEGSESAQVARLLEGPLASAYARYAVLVVRGAPSPTSAPGEALLRRLVTGLAALPEVAGVFSFLDARDSLFLPAANGSTFVIAGLGGDRDAQAPDALIPLLRAHSATVRRELAAEYPHLTLRWTGDGALNHDLRRSSSRDVARAERRALPLTAAFLLFAFGTVVAALLPVLSGALAIAVALGVATVLAAAWPLPIVLHSVVTMLGLALGIDYGLLAVTRFREGLAAGLAPAAAAALAARHGGRTILLAAATVAVGFLALLLVPLSELRGIAVGGLLAVLVSALVATTLVPGVLAALGTRVEWGRFRRRGWTSRSVARWRRLGGWVTARPRTALVLGGVPLVLLALEARGLRTGLPRGDWLPRHMESAVALRELRDGGGSGVVDALRLVVELPEGRSAWEADAWRGLSLLADSLARDPRVARVRSAVGLARASRLGLLGIRWLPDSLRRGLVSADDRLAVIEVLPGASSSPEDLSTYVRELRRWDAAGLGLAGATIRVGGLPAFNADYRDAVTSRFRQIVLLVVTGTLLALFAGTGSILIPLKAMLLNLLSVGAAFGALTLVFQEGVGGKLLGVPEPLGMVFSTLPVIVFCIVFGLSMDYEVFLVTRVMEERRAGRDERTAIIEGVAATGPVITNAAGVMLAVFAAFTLGDFLMIKLLGFALAVAVLLDATVVRMVIGPALLMLAGRWNWGPGFRLTEADRSGRTDAQMHRRTDGPCLPSGACE